jgi:hypothetical protein
MRDVDPPLKPEDPDEFDSLAPELPPPFSPEEMRDDPDEGLNGFSQ